MVTGVIVFVLLLTAQITFLLLPGSAVLFFTYALRPFAYTAALSVVWVFHGVDKRPIPKRRLSILLAGFGVLIYCAGFLITGFAVGFAYNRMASGISAFVHQLWIYATVTVMSEIVRHKLIRGAPAHRRNVLAVALTLVLTAAQLESMRGFIHTGGIGAADFVFSGVFSTLMLNAVLSFTAYEGAITALLLLRGIYSLTPVFMPVLPHINGASWAAIECFMLFVTVLIYHFCMSGQHGQRALNIKRQAKYQKQSVLMCIVTLVMAAFIIAFHLRAFDYYPAVVVSGSMAGSVDVGTVVLIEKVSAENGLEGIKQDDIILFQHENIEVLHRVIEIGHNATGGRVYITKGDANEIADTVAVEQWQVLGVNRLGVRYIGYPMVWLKTFWD